MGYAQLFPKVLLRFLNNFLQRTKRGCGAVSAQSTSSHCWADLMPFRSSWFLRVLIYFEAVFVTAQSIPVTATAHTGCRVPLSLTESACDWSVRKSSPSYCTAMPNWGMSLPKDSRLAHWWALTFFFSINVKWLFVTLMINYQYWHRDYIWLHLGWRFKNRLKNWDVQFLSSIFMRWNTASENSELNWSQCLADFLGFFLENC